MIQETPVYYLESILLGWYYISPFKRLYYYRSVKDPNNTKVTKTFDQVEWSLIDRYYNGFKYE